MGDCAKAVVRLVNRDPHKSDFTIGKYTAGKPEATGAFRAGAGKTDITPPPGYPTGGDGPAGAVTRGYWTRLSARAFYFEDARGNRLALVSCDLFALPGGLTQTAARLINTESLRLARDYNITLPAEIPITLSKSELVVAATHTHQGPGNFLSVGAFNLFGSPYSGFDRDLFDFLADRIAGAVLSAMADAYAAKEPALVQVHTTADCFAFTLDKAPFTRNRASLVFGLNGDRDQVTKDLNPSFDPATGCERLCPEPAGHNPFPAKYRIRTAGGTPTLDDESRDCEPAIGWRDTAGCPRLAATNARMTVVDVKRGPRGAERTIGIALFFPVHPTVLLPDAPVNSADFTGVAVRTLERRLTTDATHPVIVAFFNGAEGDITARRLRRDLRDVNRIATLVLQSAEGVLHTTPTVEERDPVIAVARLDARANSGGQCGITEWQQSALATRPAYGAAGFGGGEDDRTILFDLGFREGTRGQPHRGQGPKLPAFDSSLLREVRFTDCFAPPGIFPRELPVTFARLGVLSIATVPVELTVTMGYRIQQSLHLDADKSLLIGLANEYANYSTTPEEYEAQEYVGASTIWGPQEGQVLGCALDRARQMLPASPRDAVTEPETPVKPGVQPEEPFGLAFAGDPRRLADEELGRILLDKTARPARHLPWFRWTELPPVPAPADAHRDAFAGATARRVEIQERGSDGQWHPRGTLNGPDDDTGINLLTMLMDGSKFNSKGEAQWAAIWAADLFETVNAGTYRFHVTATRSNLESDRRGVAEVCSEEFTPPLPDSSQPPAPIAQAPGCR
jgi:neutral ceramidase